MFVSAIIELDTRAHLALKSFTEDDIIDLFSVDPFYPYYVFSLVFPTIFVSLLFADSVND